MGVFIFGAIYGWNIIAQAHIQYMTDKTEDREGQYGWSMTMGPLATAMGLLPCWFFSKRLGPKKTILLQTPLNIMCWVLAYFNTNVQAYHALRFFIVLFSTTYYFSGGELMIEAIHRRYQKVMYSFYKASFFLGILVADGYGHTDADVKQIFLFGCGAVAITFLFFVFLPESPVFLMRLTPERAKKSLRWYRGRYDITEELEIITNYVTFLKYETSGSMPMLKTKVVIKAIKICSMLFMLKGLSGFYAIVTCRNWFVTQSCITPDIDFAIFSSFLVVIRFISPLVHLYGAFGIKKPLLFSTFASSVLLILFGYYTFIVNRLDSKDKLVCVTLPTLCFYVCAYEAGLSICPEITLYNYLPFQIYPCVDKIMHIVMWSSVCIVVRIYLFTYRNYSHVVLWILAFNMFLSYVLVLIFVVEVKGKSLLNIQLKLGGNPVGTRGSRRQRIANPLDQSKDQITELIRLSVELDKPSESKKNEVTASSS